MIILKRGWIFAWLFVSVISCTNDNSDQFTFERLASDETGIAFANNLEYDEYLNAYTYRNFYNGAGVAVGDINNDGLQDLYFAGNLLDNKLYLNKGNFQFEDITASAGVASSNVWSTGVSMADVNGDGLLDIYVCKSGPPGGDNRKNSLFINQGDLSFIDEAEAYGVADLGLSNHAAFMDYDKDGDLDFYLLNNSTRSVGIYDLREGQRNIPDPAGGNKLYRNDGASFTDVTAEAGIYSSAIGYGLGVTVADINVDGWPDIFVSNDFFERDYLYINNQNGTFRESLEEYITETSMGSMGADIADLNADGYPEIYVTEMLPRTMDRVKTKTVFENWDKYQTNVKNGYYHQFTRNSLQLNQGKVPGKEGEVFFSEVGRQKGVHATDWSWGALIFDYDNDGRKDLFVANGIYKDLTDQDYINFYANNTRELEEYKKDSTVITRMIDAIPSVPLPNYLFKNQGDFEFTNVAEKVGLLESSFSNGAVYSDLDNDGDLDLVVSNINQEAFVYRNNTSESSANGFLTISLQGDEQNPFAFGTRVTAYVDGKAQMEEHNPVKGYMSSMDYRMHFGLGENKTVDSLDITWPDESFTRLKDLADTGFITIKKSEVPSSFRNKDTSKPGLLVPAHLSIDYRHIENEFSDFDRDRLIFQMASNEGPAAVAGDVNGDGLDDLFLGGSKGAAAQLFIQTSEGKFRQKDNTAFAQAGLSEDVDAKLADIDQDGDLDLIVASGGTEYGLGDPNLKDRIYRNDGSAGFVQLSPAEFPAVASSSGFVEVIDFNADGYPDIFTGTRSIPFSYGVPGDAFLYENQGDGSFKNVSAGQPAFKALGLLTDATATDIDNDGDTDLIVVGEWSRVRVFINEQGTFKESASTSGLEDSFGLWKTVVAGDFNADGKMDFIAGNMGLNTRLEASSDKPLTMHISDFDRNGSIEQITCMYEGDRSYPIVLLQDLVKQLPILRKKYIKYDTYKDQTLENIFSKTQLESMLTIQVQELASCVFINEGEGRFSKHRLPGEAQLSQVFAIHASDLDRDGNLDLILGGNQTRIKPELGINNASYGLTLMGVGNGTFRPLKAIESGVFVRGEVRGIAPIQVNGDIHWVFVRNNDELAVFKPNEEQ